MPISFFSETVKFRLPDNLKTASWIKKALKKEGRKLGSLEYIFCSDLYLLELNKKFLKHNTLTDIITFDYSDGSGKVEGGIYISIERVRENASKFKKSFDNELHRVIIHGVLHLLGYSDKTSSDKALMREKEEACLSLR